MQDLQLAPRHVQVHPDHPGSAWVHPAAVFRRTRDFVRALSQSCWVDCFMELRVAFLHSPPHSVVIWKRQHGHVPTSAFVERDLAQARVASNFLQCKIFVVGVFSFLIYITQASCWISCISRFISGWTHVILNGWTPTPGHYCLCQLASLEACLSFYGHRYLRLVRLKLANAR